MTIKTLEFGSDCRFEIIASPDGSALVTVDDYDGGASFSFSADQVEKLKSFLAENSHDD